MSCRIGSAKRLRCSILFLTWVLAGCGAAGSRPSGTPGELPNFILIVLDTTRADHLSLYGYPRPTTPNLERFAEHALRFEHAYSTGAWTVPSHASLFTGLLPMTHGATQETSYLADGFQTLAERLREVGYQTASFSDNPYVSTLTNLVQGFETAREMWREGRTYEGNGLPHPINLRVMEWLRQRDSARPYFIFINYMEPHWPYVAPRFYQDRFLPKSVPDETRRAADFPKQAWYLRREEIPGSLLAVRRGLYDAEIAYADAILGDLLSQLRGAGAWDDAWIVVTADHGESLGDHGHVGHALMLYDTLIHVPLLVRRPGEPEAASVRSDLVDLTDVFVTLLEAAGLRAGEPEVWGRNLFDAEGFESKPLVSEYYYPKTFLSHFPQDPKLEGLLAPYLRRLRAIRQEQHKLIWSSKGDHELYDMTEQPLEMHNLFDGLPETAQELLEQLETVVERLERPAAPRPEPAPLDRETEEQLRSLGYIQ